MVSLSELRAEPANDGSFSVSEVGDEAPRGVVGAFEAPVIFRDDQHATAILNGCECAFGVFDGFHRGHQLIVDDTLRASARKGVPCVIITFDVDPDELFCPDRLKKLMPNVRRVETLASVGADAVVVLPFTQELSRMQPQEFLDSMFLQGVPSGIHVGSDFRFGCRARGTVDTLREWGCKHGMDVRVHELASAEGAPISSTRVRSLLAACDIDAANGLLGTRHRITSRVEGGRGEGAAMGFKTANLSVPEMFRALGDGVYGAYAHVDGRCYKAAVSWGIPPTFKDTARHNCEAHILEFDGNLYGQNLTLEFVAFLRPMCVFPSTDELIATVMRDIEWVRANL